MNEDTTQGAVTVKIELDPAMVNILGLVVAERERQDARWGQQNHKPLFWLAILGEEFGEVSKELVEWEAECQRLNDQASHDPMWNRELYRRMQSSPRLSALAVELIQVVAVAVAMLESLERNQGVKL